MNESMKTGRHHNEKGRNLCVWRKPVVSIVVSHTGSAPKGEATGLLKNRLDLEKVWKFWKKKKVHSGTER